MTHFVEAASEKLHSGLIATSSGDYYDVYPDDNAIDGDIYSFWHSTEADGPRWLQIDQGDRLPVTKVVIDERQDCCRFRSSNVKCHLSKKVSKRQKLFMFRPTCMLGIQAWK